MRTKDNLKFPPQVLVDTLANQASIDLSGGVRLMMQEQKVFLTDSRTLVPLQWAPADLGACLEEIESKFSLRFVGANGRIAFRTSQPPDGLIQGDYFVEALLEPSEAIDYHLRQYVSKVSGTPWSPQSQEILLTIVNGVRDGQLELKTFEKVLSEKFFAPRAHGYALFFAYNVHMMVEQLRSVLIRTFERAEMLQLGTIRLNENEDGRWYAQFDGPREIFHASPEAERLHAAFTESVSGIATALDLICRLFVYLTREPFGNPNLPGIIHFPWHEKGKKYSPFREGGCAHSNDAPAKDLPYALPNLTAGAFFGLRTLRNDFTHNLASGFTQPFCWIGAGTPHIGNLPLRYVQFLVPDIDPEGKTIKHEWVERFFRTQRDATIVLSGWLEELVLCSDHTLRWLEKRVSQVSTAATPPQKRPSTAPSPSKPSSSASPPSKHSSKAAPSRNVSQNKRPRKSR